MHFLKGVVICLNILWHWIRARPAADVFFAVETAADARTLSVAWGIQAVVGKLADAEAKAKACLGLKAGDTVIKVSGKKFEITEI